MKKIIVFVLLAILLSGCTKLDSTYKNVINEAITSKNEVYNTYRKGYKFYLPKGLYVDKKDEYNEVIKSNGVEYFLYIDILNYLNKKENSFVKNNSAIYSEEFSYNNKYGYVEINKRNDKYLVEIMYNYAKIEVMVDEESLGLAVANSIVILSSIYYNDNLLNNLSSDNILNYSEETVDIFKTNGKDTSNFLQYKEVYEDDDEEDIPDYDLIR